MKHRLDMLLLCDPLSAEPLSYEMTAVLSSCFAFRMQKAECHAAAAFSRASVQTFSLAPVACSVSVDPQHVRLDDFS